MSTFSDRLEEARKEYEAKMDEAEAHTQELESRKTRQRFVRAFGFEPPRVDGMFVIDDETGVTIKRVDPITTMLSAGWAVMGHCPHCHKLVASRACQTLGEIADCIQNFVPGDVHQRACTVIDVAVLHELRGRKAIR